MDQDKEISHMLKKTSASFESLEDCEKLFLAVEPAYKSYLLQLISESATFENTYVTIVDSSKGLIFYTRNKNNLGMLIESLLK